MKTIFVALREFMKNYSKTEILKFFEDMYLIRFFEEKTAQLYAEGLVAGFCHLYIGEEAVVTGVRHAMEPYDTTVTSYRDHGHALMCGVDPRYVMAELTGRRDGCSKGKGGSMHMFSREKNFFGGHGIVGACVPIGTGVAFSHKYLKEKSVCITYMGDGTLNQGQVSEAFNMAALWKLPILYIIENNFYALGTALSRARACTELYKAGTAFGIPGESVDGMDVFAMYETTKKALEYVRSGKGPMILEAKTYRYRGHSMSDPATYRTKEEVEKYKALDPIDKIRAILDAKDVEEAEKRVKSAVKEAVEFARNSPEPDVSELYTNVLV